MNAKVLGAVFKRNFVSYFSNPTGYVFMCLFVALSSAAAFWPEEFFKANLANLNQLTYWFAPIMLVFVPAITMSIWAEERRQGTDELLLTMPANDFDVVVGKYLAALAIYTVSLLFSLVSIGIILRWLGEPDFGLILCNYLGYFFVGMAMLAIGMMGSFLTSNLTIAFVIGFLLNVPLVILQYANLPFLPSSLTKFGITSQLDDFGRGVLSLSSTCYFLGVVAVSLFISMILIERRHWGGGRDEAAKLGHFVIRAVALVVAVGSFVVFTSNHDIVRADLSTDRINSISPDTKNLIAELDEKETKQLAEEQAALEAKLAEIEKKDDEAEKKRQELEDELAKLKGQLRHLGREVTIEAFVSPTVPEKYVKQRLTLLTRLKELAQLRPDKLKVHIYPTTNYSDEAKRAEKEYGILPVRRRVDRWAEEKFVLGAAIKAGLDKVVIPFFDVGTPIEYELVRSICIVGQPERKKLGVINTDAKMMGGMDPPQMFANELDKQYELVDVNARTAIVDPDDPESLNKYAALLVVQPSALPQAQMENVIAAIKAGVPTAIFEDPLSAWYGPSNQNAPRLQGTDATRPPQSSPFGPPRPQEPKGDLTTLLKVLGIKMVKVKSHSLPREIRKKQKTEGYEDPDLTFARLDRDDSKTLSLTEFLNESDSDEKKRHEAASEDESELIKSFEFQNMAGQDDLISPDEFMETAVVWQNYNPYPKLDQVAFLTNEWVFAGSNSPGADAQFTLPNGTKITEAFSSKSKITSEMNEVLFLAPGAIKPLKDADTEFIPLVTTGNRAGVIRVNDFRNAGDEKSEVEAAEIAAAERFVLAAQIRAKKAGSDDKAEPQQDEAKNEKSDAKKRGINVVFVADVDVLSEASLVIREQRVEDIDLFMQTVPFALNVIDHLAGDNRFLNIRKNEVRYRRLTTVEDRQDVSREQSYAEKKRFQGEFKDQIEVLEEQDRKIGDELKKLQEKLRTADPIERKLLNDQLSLLTLKRVQAEQDFKDEQTRLAQELNKQIEKNEDELSGELKNLVDRYKWLAVLLPPIPPLLIAIGVFLSRRAREKEGVSKKRLR